MKNTDKLHTIAFRIPVDQYEILRLIAFNGHVSLAKACRQAMKEFCEKYGK
jgi:hypothetical protein